MKLTLLAVGKLKERHYEAACADYDKRIRRYLPLEVIEVKNDAALLGRVPPRAELWGLSEHGRQVTTRELAGLIEKRMNAGAAGIAFALGGAEGLSEPVRQASSEWLALGRITLAHRLARLVLLEQIYRCLTIIRGEPYHRD